MQQSIMHIVRATFLAVLGAGLLVVVGTAKSPVPGTSSSARDQFDNMQQWFNKMDVSQDGQLQEGELRRFIGAHLGPTDFNTGKKLDQAVEQVTEKLDTADSGLTISLMELDQYLHKILQGVKVSDWVAHSLGLPVYAEAFRENAITVLDFPMLVNDGGKLLETELMVTRVLHRHKIMRAMQRQMLGLGVEPGSIKQLRCSSSSSSSSGVAQHTSSKHSSNSSTMSTTTRASSVSFSDKLGVPSAGPAAAAAAPPGVVHCVWQAPDTLGQPPLHKFVLERFAVHMPGGKWQTAAELDDISMTQFNDITTQPGSYQYRIAAWNMYGRSPYAFSDEVPVTAFGVVTQQAGIPAIVGQRYVITVNGTCAQYDSMKNEAAALNSSNSSSATTSKPMTATQKFNGQQQECSAAAYLHLKQQQQQQQQQQLDQQSHYRSWVDDLALFSSSLSATQLQSESQGKAVAVAQPSQSLKTQQWSSSSSSSGGRTSEDGAQDIDSTSSIMHDRLPSDWVQHTVGSACGVGSVPESNNISISGDSCSSGAPTALDRKALVVPTGRAPLAAVPSGPNVVWVVGQNALTDNSPSTPAALVAQMQLLQSMQTAASGQNIQSNMGQNTNKKVAGSWSAAAIIAAWLGKWLKAVINSLILLVVPVCVRLLPVPVLHQLARAVAHALQWLPLPMQRGVQRLLAAARMSEHQAPAGQVAVAIAAGNIADSGLAGSAGVPSCRVVTSSSLRPSSSSGGTSAEPTSHGTPLAPGSVDAQLSIRQRNIIEMQCQQGLPVATALARADVGVSLGTGAVGGAALSQQSSACSSAGDACDTKRQREVEQYGISASVGVSVRMAELTNSSSEVALLRHGSSSSPGSSMKVCNSTAAQETAGPYAGIYGFGWPADTAAPMYSTAYNRSGAAVAAQNCLQEAVSRADAVVSPDVQEITAGSAAGSEHIPCQQQRSRVILAGATGQSGCDSSSHGGPAGPAGRLMFARQLTNRKRCAFPGCTQQFDLRNWRAMNQRHYCGRCQQAFCLAHTAYSPHGPGGGCGAESRCVCCNCFYDFTPEYRMFLSSRNTLQNSSNRRTKSGPPGARGSNDSGCSSNEGMDTAAVKAASRSSPVLHAPKQYLQQLLQRQPAAPKQCSRGSSESNSLPHGDALQADISSSQSPQSAVEHITAAPLDRAGAVKQPRSSMLWSKAWTKATAVVRLSHAGHRQLQIEHEQEVQH